MNDTEIKLTGKQEMFCLAYTGEARFNATEAARIAGYDGDDNSLRSIGHENLTKLDIKNRIKELTEQRFNDAGYQVDRVIKELTDIAFADVTLFQDICGEINIDRATQPTAAIKEIEQTILMGHSGRKTARHLVENAIKNGTIIPSKCEECGDEGEVADGKSKVQAHHDDYSKPLDIRWLCTGCHAKWHSVNKASDEGVRNIKLKFHDKKWALEMLSKLLDMDSGKEIIKVSGFKVIKAEPEKQEHKE